MSNWGMTECTFCGIEFSKTGPRNTLCSDDCKESNAKRWQKSKNKNPEGATDFGHADCVNCGKGFAKSHWLTKKCSQACIKEYAAKAKSTWYADNLDHAKARDRQYRLDNPERTAATRRDYYLRNTEEIKRKVSEYSKANAAHLWDMKKIWRANNPELVKRYTATSYRRNRDAKRAYYEAHYESNKAAYRDAARRRRVAKLNAPKGEPYTAAGIFERDGWTCHLCGFGIERDAHHLDPISGHIDHVVPISREGCDGAENVKASHARCNLSKHNSLMSELALPMGGPPTWDEWELDYAA